MSHCASYHRGTEASPITIVRIQTYNPVSAKMLSPEILNMSIGMHLFMIKTGVRFRDKGNTKEVAKL